jgi:hypothetical protein
MGVGATVLRGYLGKVSNKVRVTSKAPRYSYNRTPMNHCRETCATRIREGIIDGAANVNGKSYYVMPVASMVNKGGSIFCGESSIRFEMGRDLSVSDKDFRQALDYTLSIIGVLFCSDEGERRRRRRGLGKAGSTEISHDGGYTDITYNVLSPLWLITPITVSFVLGTMRNVICLTEHNNAIVHKKLFDKVSYTEVKRIIDECDRQAAMHIYKKVILPFFDSAEFSGNSDVFLSQGHVRRTISPLINDGIKAHLYPEKTRKYWNNLDSHYGISQFNIHKDSYDSINNKCK